jgi:hypothetical protein
MAHKPTSSVSSIRSDGSFASTISDVFMTVLGNMGSLHTTAMLTGSAREHLDALARKDERWTGVVSELLIPYMRTSMPLRS